MLSIAASSIPSCSLLFSPSARSSFLPRSSPSASFLLGFLQDRALAVSYNDVLENVSQNERALPLPSLDVDVGGTLDSVLEFINGNPLAIIAGVTAVAVPILVSKFIGGSNNWGFVSAKDAFQKLGDTQSQTQLIDIRDAGSSRAEGSPDLRDYKKKGLQIAYSSESTTFLQNALVKIKNPAETAVYILDRFDGNSIEAAKLLATNGFKSAYAIKDGADGWQKSQLPWLVPQKGLLFDIGALTNVFGNTLNESSNLVPASLGIAAAAGVGLAVFSEAETALQLVGSVALVQLFFKKFLFAKDRNKTFEELQVFLDTKVAPKELVDEIKEIGKGFLPNTKQVTAESESNVALIAETTEVKKVEVPETPEASKEPLQDILENKHAEKDDTELLPTASSHSGLPHSSRPLSPYHQVKSWTSEAGSSVSGFEASNITNTFDTLKFFQNRVYWMHCRNHDYSGILSHLNVIFAN